MIFNDVIHVQTEGGGEDGNVEDIDISEINDCMCVVHDV
jgi:hypothetical protein